MIAGALAPIGALGLARPRFVGGGAFAVGAAGAAPWAGFGDAWFVLPRWTYVHDGGDHAWLVLAIDAGTADDRDRWHRELAAWLHAERAWRSRDRRHERLDARVHPSGRVDRDVDGWHERVSSIVDEIERGRARKIVAARSCTVASEQPIDIARVLRALDARHGDCVRAAIQPRRSGTLIAATPERLVCRDGDTITCDALAGSIERRADRADTDERAALLASAKDRHEHALVVDAIRDALAASGAVVDAPAVPDVRTLHHLHHLHTPIRGVAVRPRHVLELAARLHPTPAVGGVPRDVAAAWIAVHEPEPRGWYASPIGWFDFEGDGELVVALRSALVDDRSARLWAGAGIVAGSDPDRELAETELKLRAMLGALGVAPEARP